MKLAGSLVDVLLFHYFDTIPIGMLEIGVQILLIKVAVNRSKQIINKSVAVKDQEFLANNPTGGVHPSLGRRHWNCNDYLYYDMLKARTIITIGGQILKIKMNKLSAPDSTFI